MTFADILFIILVASTFVSNGVQAYIHFEAYPLLASVGKAEFAGYLKEYERRLMIPLLLPYGITMLSNLILIFTHTDYAGLGWFAVLFVINLAVALVTQFVATPVYNRVKQAGAATGPDMAQLMRINWIRLGLSTLSSAILIFLMTRLMS